MKIKTEDSPALNFLQTGWDAIPRRSWRNRNGAMQSMLTAAITSGMEFAENDIREIYSRFNAGFWIGESYEGYYREACAARSGANISAAIALEKGIKREPVLWAERTKTPERLYVGEQFNWDGMRLTITSMGAEELIGCTYKEDRSIKNRVRVSYADIKAKRKGFDDNFRAWKRKIEQAETLDALSEIRIQFSSGEREAFRHFDIEILRACFAEKTKCITESLSAEERAQQQKKEKAERDATHDADLARWMAGETVRRGFDVVRLRIKGDTVETSTGFTATLDGVKDALPFVKRYRLRGWHANGKTMDLDEYPIQLVTKHGVQVGCTFVEWPEIDRISALLK